MAFRSKTTPVHLCAGLRIPRSAGTSPPNSIRAKRSTHSPEQWLSTALGVSGTAGHENQASRAAAPNLVTAIIILFNCRYLGRVVEAMRRRETAFDNRIIPQLSPLGWGHINITGDYVWSDHLMVDDEGFLPLRIWRLMPPDIPRPDGCGEPLGLGSVMLTMWVSNGDEP